MNSSSVSDLLCFLMCPNRNRKTAAVWASRLDRQISSRSWDFDENQILDTFVKTDVRKIPVASGRIAMTDTSSNSSGSEGEPGTELPSAAPEAQEASEDFSAARVKVTYSEQRSASLQDPEPDFGDGADGADGLDGLDGAADGLDGLDGADGAGNEDLEADVRDLACVIISFRVVSSCFLPVGPI